MDTHVIFVYDAQFEQFKLGDTHIPSQTAAYPVAIEEAERVLSATYRTRRIDSTLVVGVERRSVQSAVAHAGTLFPSRTSGSSSPAGLQAIKFRQGGRSW